MDVSSLYGMFMYDYEPDKQRLRTAAASLGHELLNSAPIGGSPRYEIDHYFASDPAYKGNPWIVTTLWLAQFYVRTGDIEAAKGLVRWSLDRCLPSGVLAEQFNPTNGTAVGVTPLVWSHAELVNTILDISGAN